MLLLGIPQLSGACTVSSSSVRPTASEPVTSVTYEGTVARYDRLPPPEQQLQQNAVITLHTSGTPLRVELAPGWFLDQQGLRFEREQAITISGTARDDDGTIVAQEVRQGSRVVRLRDANGKPLWQEEGPEQGPSPED